MTRNDGSVIDFAEVQKYINVTVVQREESWEKWQPSPNVTTLRKIGKSKLLKIEKCGKNF